MRITLNIKKYNKMSNMIWDSLFIQGNIIIFKTIIAIFNLLKTELMGKTSIEEINNIFEENTKYLNDFNYINYYLILKKFEFNYKIIQINRQELELKIAESINNTNRFNLERIKKNKEDNKKASFVKSINECYEEWPICIYDNDYKYRIVKFFYFIVHRDKIKMINNYFYPEYSLNEIKECPENYSKEKDKDNYKGKNKEKDKEKIKEKDKEKNKEKDKEKIKENADHNYSSCNTKFFENKVNNEMYENSKLNIQEYKNVDYSISNDERESKIKKNCNINSENSLNGKTNNIYCGFSTINFSEMDIYKELLIERRPHFCNSRKHIVVETTRRSSNPNSNNKVLKNSVPQSNDSGERLFSLCNNINNNLYDHNNTANYQKDDLIRSYPNDNHYLQFCNNSEKSYHVGSFNSNGSLIGCNDTSNNLINYKKSNF